MSSSDSEFPPSTVPALFSFGGYVEEPGALQGVGFWPRAGARVIDLVVHYLIGFFAGTLIGVVLVAANYGRTDPVLFARRRHTGFTGFLFALLGSVWHSRQRPAEWPAGYA